MYNGFGYLDLIFNMIDTFVGVSDFTTRIEILNRFPEAAEKTLAIHNGINLKTFQPKWTYSEKDRHALKQKLGASPQDKLLLFVGRLSPQKGILQLLQACQTLFPRFPEWKLLVVGSSWFGKDQETAFTRQLRTVSEPIRDKVIFTGYIPKSDLPHVYAASDLFVAPSLMEDPSPNVCYEAQAAGLPILAARRGGIPEIIAENETASLIDTPENPDKIAGKLEGMLTDSTSFHPMGQAGRTRVEQRFSWSETARKTEELYDRLLS